MVWFLRLILAMRIEICCTKIQDYKLLGINFTLQKYLLQMLLTKKKKKEKKHESWTCLNYLGLPSNKMNQSKISLKKDNIVQLIRGRVQTTLKVFYS